MFSKLNNVVSKGLVSYPKRTLFFFFACMLGLSFFVYRFQVDASADTLINKNDPDFVRMQALSKQYQTSDTLFLVFTPHADLFSPDSFEALRHLKKDLLQLPDVSYVTTILDVPLFKSTSLSMQETVKQLPTLESPLVDLKKARAEFVTSPLYKDLLINASGKTTAIQVTFKTPKNGVWNSHQNIEDIRSILKRYSSEGALYLGGISVISNDMIDIIRDDLSIFGFVVFGAMILVLALIFRLPRWVFISVLSCGLSVIAMMGLLGLMNWKVTVISSNFISLQIILTLSLVIHLIVQYRELRRDHPEMDQKTLVQEAIRDKLTPSIFTTLTTMIGFASLVLSNIKPIISFGYMMLGGLFISIIVTFVFFGSFMVLLKRSEVHHNPGRVSAASDAFLTFFAVTSDRYRKSLIWISLLILLVGGIGISKLTVENSFINYFNSKTDIYKTLSYIDQNLGGTTPLDIVIKLDPPSKEPQTQDVSVPEDDDFALFDDVTAQSSDPKYWFTPEKVALIQKTHSYLESLPHVGKVLSLATPMEIAEDLNGGKPLNSLELAVLYESLPNNIKSSLVNQYVNIDKNELRLTLRIYDSHPDLRRAALIEEIRDGLETKVGLKKDQFELSGILILYNNMLQDLFASQILTLGTSILFLVFVLLFLFRSLKLALMAVVPNILAVVFILGFMGWFGFPLDMMTITIAAITLGIGVEDAIHYIYHFCQEYEKDKDGLAAMYRSHKSIGMAMFFTSLVVSIGFGVLVFSTFIPNVLFGLFTAMAMTVALLASLTVLPALLLIFYNPK